MKKFSARKLDALLSDERVSIAGIQRFAGVSHNCIRKLRRGLSVPSANTLAVLAEAFEKPIEYFFEEESTSGEVLKNGTR
jgi:transcriptional regulator with XRE-family HTH domain